MQGHESRRLAGKLGNHARSNAIAYIALFFAVGGGTAFAANTVFSSDIVNGEVTSADIGGQEVQTSDIGNDTVTGAKIPNESIGNVDLKAGAVRGSEIANGQVGTQEIADSAVDAAKIATDGVGSSEIATDSVGSSEIQSGVVGADELDTVHEHFGPATDITDGTLHDGSYATGTATVACGTGEDLLSVSVDWTDRGGHNEVVTSGVDVIDRTTDPETATVRVAWDGGAGPATFQPVATCIF